MSIPAKLTLCSAIVVSIGIVGYVHIKQQNDRLAKIFLQNNSDDSNFVF